MVSKTPTKPAKISPKSKPRRHRTPKPICGHSRRRCAKPSPLKSFAVSIDRSIRSCRRRLVKLFADLAVFGTPNGHKNGFRRLKSTPEKHPSPPAPAAANGDNRKPLPPLSCPAKKTIFLDLDETLVHSKTDPAPEHYDFTVRPKIDGQAITFYVLKRPGVDEFLREAAKDFELVVFTAGLKEYASLVLDRLDSKGDVISHRLYRDSCRKLGGMFVKDLSAVGRELDRVVIVDDNPNTYIFQPENAVPMSPFVDNLADRELWKLRKFLQVANAREDMKEAIKYYLANFRDRK